MSKVAAAKLYSECVYIVRIDQTYTNCKIMNIESLLLPSSLRHRRLIGFGEVHRYFHPT